MRSNIDARRIAVDEQQLFILIGELKSGQAAVRVAVEDLTDSTNSLQKKVNALPCSEHSVNIQALSDWRTACNSTTQAAKLEQLKGTISLRNGIVLIVATAIITGMATQLINMLAR